MLLTPLVIYLLIAAAPHSNDAVIELDAAAFERGARRILPMIQKSREIDLRDRYRSVKHAASLEGLWRYSNRGEDPAAPSVNLDDSSWKLRSNDLSEWPGNETFGDAGWFRIRIRGADNLGDRALGLLISNSGPIEVWLDGQPIFEQPFTFDPTPHPLYLHQAEHLLAIRLDGGGMEQLRDRGLASGFFPALVDLQPYLAEVRPRRDSAPIFFAGAALALALLHLCMYALMRDRRENLFFALEVFSVAGILASSTTTPLALSSFDLLWRVSAFQISVVGTALFGLIAAYLIFLPELPKRVKYLSVAAVLAVIVGQIGPLFVPHLFAILLLFEQVRVVVTAFFKKMPGSKIIGVGSVIFLFTAFLQLLATIKVVELFEPLIYMYGFTCLLIAMSFYLAHRFAGVSRLQQVLAELRAAQSQLVQSEKMASLGALVAGVAHEINTPIGAINSVHDSLKRALDKLRAELEATNPNAIEENNKLKGPFRVIDDATRVIESGTSRVTEIVKRLRSFARLDEADLKKVDIHEGIEDTLMLLHHQLKHGVSVVKDYGEVPQIACYPSQLNQVYLNLLVNARQAIPKDGEIRITTGLREKYVFIEIKDNGAGIPAENLKKIFDPGFTTKGVGVGTGLGLSISYRIMQQHKGEIRVESEIGKGTTFTLLIPMNLA